jgi:hypothetical protein
LNFYDIHLSLVLILKIYGLNWNDNFLFLWAYFFIFFQGTFFGDFFVSKNETKWNKKSPFQNNVHVNYMWHILTYHRYLLRYMKKSTKKSPKITKKGGIFFKSFLYNICKILKGSWKINIFWISQKYFDFWKMDKKNVQNRSFQKALTDEIFCLDT